jgi:ubiquinone/menaquinone biosynthesis C-methylase UbiE
MANQPGIISRIGYVGRRLAAAARGLRYRNNPEQIVAKGYDEMAGDYGSWTLRHERSDRVKYTQLLLDNVPDGSELLELGCGPGDPTTKLLSQHYKVTANDISESCLQLAKQNAPTANFIRADMTELRFDPGSFDAVVAYYAFHHVPRDRYEPLINDIARWLRPGGIFMAALYPYDVEHLVTENWHGSTMYWSSFDEEKTLELITNPGFEIIAQSKESEEEDGKETTFLWVIARKPE